MADDKLAGVITQERYETKRRVIHGVKLRLWELASNGIV